MRILIDECLPKHLAQIIPTHQTDAVVSVGWSGKKNGELLKLAEAARYDVFITADQNLQYQQNLKNREIAIIVLKLESIRMQSIQVILPQLLQMLQSINKNDFIILEA